jgi:hypothetical protein
MIKPKSPMEFTLDDNELIAEYDVHQNETFIRFKDDNCVVRFINPPDLVNALKVWSETKTWLIPIGQEIELLPPNMA